jgi:hypothetical protein
VTPLLDVPSRRLSRISITPPLLWRTGTLFGLGFSWPLYSTQPSVLLPVAAGILTGAFGTHALKSMAGLSKDRVEAFITAAHYAVNN